jgi:adenosylcobyric acid synthase
MSKALMFQGTGSDVGKSLVVAGLARAFANRGLRVAPFKPQNMSNNAAVTADNGEIGRAQALQALAARLKPCVDMNPVLLKPQGASGSQVVAQGRVLGQATAREFQQWKSRLEPIVFESFERVKSQADLVLVEGAGSAAEINLRENDIANMGFARKANAPVVIVADIDRGGVIAQLAGCKAVIAEDDAALIEGFIVNKFRGDPTLFEDGMRIIAERTNWRALGLLPYFEAAARLPAEDAFGLRDARSAPHGDIVIAVPLLPNIANFDDLDPLKAEPDVRLAFVRPGEPLPAQAQLVILPGSKATIADLQALRAAGWHIDIAAHIRRGGRVLGLCGGYQMMGRSIADPHGVEGPPGEVEGLGLLDVATTLRASKTLREVSGESVCDGAAFRGYEMHVGETRGEDCARPVLRFDDGRFDGASSRDGLARGVYVHGLFADDGQRAALLRVLGGAPSKLRYEQSIDETLDAFAEHCARHIDLDLLLSLAR